MLIDEWAPGVLDLPDPEVEDDMRFICDFCSADIFVSYFECDKCRTTSGDPIALCSLCYASGRTCRCVRMMRPAVTMSYQRILEERNKVAKIVADASSESFPQMTEKCVASVTFEMYISDGSQAHHSKSGTADVSSWLYDLRKPQEHQETAPRAVSVQPVLCTFLVNASALPVSDRFLEPRHTERANPHVRLV